MEPATSRFPKIPCSLAKISSATEGWQSSTSELNSMASPSEIVRRIERIRQPISKSSYNHVSVLNNGMSECFAGSGLGFSRSLIVHLCTAAGHRLVCGLHDRHGAERVFDRYRQRGGSAVEITHQARHAAHERLREPGALELQALPFGRLALLEFHVLELVGQSSRIVEQHAQPRFDGAARAFPFRVTLLMLGAILMAVVRLDIGAHHVPVIHDYRRAAGG